MSMVACAICGKTIDCSGWDYYVCLGCGRAVHFSCDNTRLKGTYICYECRKQDSNISPIQGLKINSPPLPTIKDIVKEIKDTEIEALPPPRLPKLGDMWGAKICPLHFREKQDNNESESKS